MDSRKKLEELNAATLEKFKEYMKAKEETGKEHHEKIHAAKDEWQVAWNNLLETLLVLERLEI